MMIVFLGLVWFVLEMEWLGVRTWQVVFLRFVVLVVFGFGGLERGFHLDLSVLVARRWERRGSVLSFMELCVSV